MPRHHPTASFVDWAPLKCSFTNELQVSGIIHCTNRYHLQQWMEEKNLQRYKKQTNYDHRIAVFQGLVCYCRWFSAFTLCPCLLHVIKRWDWEQLFFCENCVLKCILRRKITSKWKLEELVSLETELIKFVNSSQIISLSHWWLAVEGCQKVCHNVLRPVCFGRVV